jgi:hypothetical protein
MEIPTVVAAETVSLRYVMFGYLGAASEGALLLRSFKFWFRHGRPPRGRLWLKFQCGHPTGSIRKSDHK